jgi:hypothetical protein
LTAFVVKIEETVKELKEQQIQVTWRAPLTFKGFNLLQPYIQGWLSRLGQVQRGKLTPKWGRSQNWPDTAFNQVKQELINDFVTSAKVATENDVEATLKTISNTLGFDSATGAPIAMSSSAATATSATASQSQAITQGQPVTEAGRNFLAETMALKKPPIRHR